MDLSFLDDEIDEQATCNKVRRFFKKQVPRLIRLSGLNLVSLKSPELSSMPTSKPAGNTNEDRIVRKLEAQRIITAVVQAIRICGEPSNTILFGVYLQGLPNWQVEQQLGYGASRFYQLKNQSFLNFADAFAEADLHVYK
ncbi:hypothetical protein M3M38_01990 [Fructilactobacillus cliffordii]|uniref:ArpU family phage packaging/lysis transcriptional regulator n=1 Tax=Fructilactobacillus cliffordii TaxID=2940299 RepID=UPI002092E57F|nr:ArpU family phage packaging/lysis transcriptional regulator [Fructilactobacillus cliffordii]USS86857.1 hypothetical protein M3M38_01990 [Fructilactobacillus cliffordii]